MKMITGFIAPSEGSIRVYGHQVEQEPVLCKRQIGYLPEGAPSYAGDDTGKLPGVHRRPARPAR